MRPVKNLAHRPVQVRPQCQSGAARVLVKCISGDPEHFPSAAELISHWCTELSPSSGPSASPSAGPSASESRRSASPSDTGVSPSEGPVNLQSELVLRRSDVQCFSQCWPERHSVPLPAGPSVSPSTGPSVYAQRCS
jgi:hypothetical protein